jgi:hypothetical protein
LDESSVPSNRKKEKEERKKERKKKIVLLFWLKGKEVKRTSSFNK